MIYETLLIKKMYFLKKMTPNDFQTVQIQFAFKFQLIITRYPKEIMKMEQHFSGLQRWLQN